MSGAGWARCAAWLIVCAVPCCRPGFQAGAEAVPAGKEYRISGVVLSGRDGSPVPYARVSASLSGAMMMANGVVPRGIGTRQNGNPVDRTGPGRGGGQPPANRAGGRPGPASGAQGSNTNPEVRADSGGRFRLELPQRGSWRVTATARGFRTQAYDEHDGYFSSVILSDAAPTYELKFQLTPDSGISGLVLDEAGEPVLNAQVIAEFVPPLAPGESRASPAARPRQVANAQTDDRGRYELTGLQDGEYHVRVQAQPWYAAGARGGNRFAGGNVAGGVAAATGSGPGQLDPSLDVAYPTMWFPGADGEESAETIKLTGGEERQADFHLTAIPALHLVVTRPDEPIAVAGGGQAQSGDRGQQPQQRGISITRVSADGQYGQTSFIGGNGREWNFGGLSPGTYEVRIPGPAGEQDAEVRQIEVRPGATSVITMDGSKPLTRVTIAVDGAEAEGATVEFFDTASGRRILAMRPQRGRRGRDGDDGYSDEDQPKSMSAVVPPGRYEVNIIGGSAYITGISATGAKVVGSSVVIGESPATLTVQVATGRGEVSGFTKIDGAPEPGAMVLLVPATLGQPGDATPVMRDQSNTDGSFDLLGVVPGRYILVAIDHGWRVDWRNQEMLAKYLAQGVPVELKASAKLKEMITGVLP